MTQCCLHILETNKKECVAILGPTLETSMSMFSFSSPQCTVFPKIIPPGAIQKQCCSASVGRSLMTKEAHIIAAPQHTNSSLWHTLSVWLDVSRLVQRTGNNVHEKQCSGKVLLSAKQKCKFYVPCQNRQQAMTESIQRCQLLIRILFRRIKRGEAGGLKHSLGNPLFDWQMNYSSFSLFHVPFYDSYDFLQMHIQA